MIQHHSPEDDEAARRFIEEVVGVAPRKWPDGRVSGDDDGETAYAIAADPVHNIVHLKFTKPMDWLGFDVASARQLAAALIEKADQLERLAKLKA